LAGFIEPGETVEEALKREVLEEVGVEVENIKYFGSQSWPFPSQLMLGYFAEYKSGEIIPDNTEIDKADWFEIDNLPNVPPSNISISGKLIEAYIEKFN
jgi:NAD+ diphosphatase